MTESWLFHIEKQDGSIIIDEDAVKIVPEFNNLSQEEIRYMVLVEDYVKSPLKRRPREERMRVAGSLIYKNEDFKPSVKLQKAMVLYHSFIFEIKHETVEMLNTKVSKLNKKLADDPDANLKTELYNIKFAFEKIDELNKEIEKDDEERKLKLKGDRKLSKLERWQINRKRYNEYYE